MGDREKKRKMEIQIFEYLENEKTFSDEIKSIFHSFLRAIIWWRIKVFKKIANTSFKTEQLKESPLQILRKKRMYRTWCGENNR